MLIKQLVQRELEELEQRSSRQLAKIERLEEDLKFEREMHKQTLGEIKELENFLSSHSTNEGVSNHKTVDRLPVREVQQTPGEN